MNMIAENADAPRTATEMERWLNDALWSLDPVDGSCPVCGGVGARWEADDDGASVTAYCSGGCSGPDVAAALGLPAAPPGVVLCPDEMAAWAGPPPPAWSVQPEAATAPAEDEDDDDEAVYTPPDEDDDDDEAPADIDDLVDVLSERLEAQRDPSGRMACPACGTPGPVHFQELGPTLVLARCMGGCSGSAIAAALKAPPLPGVQVRYWAGAFRVDDDQAPAQRAAYVLREVGVYESRSSRPVLFDGGGRLVVVKGGEMVTATEADVRARLAEVAWWQKVGPSTRPGYVHVDPPAALVKAIVARGQYDGFPALERVATAPFFAPGGRLVRSVKGGRGVYDRETRTYVAMSAALEALADPGDGEDMHYLDPAEAVRVLRDDLLGDFPLVGDADRAHTIALALLPFVRPMIRGLTPLHYFSAPASRTGKSLLAACALTPALGRVEEPIKFSETNLRKVVREGADVAFFDNVTGTLKSPLFDAVLTARRFEGMPVRQVWVMTGNNLELHHDTRGRTVMVRLDAGVEDPEQRTGPTVGPRAGLPWLHALPSWAEDNRAVLVHAALSVVGAWVDAGMPRATERTLGGFEDWAAIMGGILDVAGVPGFLGNRAEMLDDETETLAAFLWAWWEDFGSREVTAAEVVKALEGAVDGSGASTVIYRTQGVPRTTVGLGRWLSAHRDKVAGGLRLTRRGGERSAATWRVSAAVDAVDGAVDG